MTPLPFRLLLITDPTIPGWLDAVLAAVEAGGDRVAVQVRDPRAGAAELAHLARGVRAAAPGTIVIVNDRCDVARVSGAHGVHLKESGLEIADARALPGLAAGIGIVGASCHDARGIARRAGADYVTLGPFGDVPGKGAGMGAATFASIARDATMPVLALGGIDAAAARDAVRAGAHGVAVLRGIQGARDPRAATLGIMDGILDALDTRDVLA